MLEITVYWNKVIQDKTQPFGTRVLPDYEIKTVYHVDNTLADLKKRWKGNPKMEFHKDHIKENDGKQFGIHSYRIIREV